MYSCSLPALRFSILNSSANLAAICIHTLVSGGETADEHAEHNEPCCEEEPPAQRHFTAARHLFVHSLKDSMQVSCH